MFYVYLLASKPFGTLYVGMTSDLVKRVFEHKTKVVPGFTARYGVANLVWFEAHDSVEAAIRREKQIKEWKREWKFNLIEQPALDRSLPELDAITVVPAQAGTHGCRGYRPAPVWCDATDSAC